MLRTLVAETREWKEKHYHYLQEQPVFWLDRKGAHFYISVCISSNATSKDPHLIYEILFHIETSMNVTSER